MTPVGPDSSVLGTIWDEAWNWIGQRPAAAWAAFAAVMSVIVALITLGRDVRGRRVDRESARLRQRNSISAWDRAEGRGTGGVESPYGTPAQAIDVPLSVINASDLPIWNVWIRGFVIVRYRASDDGTEAGATVDHRSQVVGVDFDVVPPGERRPLPDHEVGTTERVVVWGPPGWAVDHSPDRYDPAIRRVVILDFTDQADQHWQRVDRGPWRQMPRPIVDGNEPPADFHRLYPGTVPPEIWTQPPNSTP